MMAKNCIGPAIMLGAARPRSLPSSEKIAARKLSRATTIAMLWNAKLSRMVSSVAALESRLKKTLIQMKNPRPATTMAPDFALLESMALSP